MLAIAEVALLAALAVLLCVAALGDVRNYRISNKLNLAIAALSAPYWVVFFLSQQTNISSNLMPQLILIAIAFVIFLAMMLLNVIGGGDAKLLFALSFWLKPTLYLDMLMSTAIAGGVLCIIILARHRFTPTAPTTDMNGDVVVSKFKQRVPYGVAIAAGALIPVSQLILNALMR